MFEDFYSFTGTPFRLSPDSRFFFGSNEHQKAMAFLNYGISQGEGFVVVTGEVGAGKTTLVEHLLSTLDPAHYVAGRIVTTQLDSHDILRMAAASFRLEHQGRDKASLLMDLKQMFDGLQQAHKRPLLVVDEAQSLTPQAPEELRMLINLQTNGGTAFQVILLGQPEFRAVFSSAGFEQVRQRVAASCHLGPLDASDTKAYIEHRLRQVGWHNDPSITAGAFDEIYQATAGIPRRINTLCSRLLLLGFLDQKHAIDEKMVLGVARELAGELGSLGHVSRKAGTATSSPPENSGRLSAPRRSSAVRAEEIDRRLDRMEKTLGRHDRVIVRALDLVTTNLSWTSDADESAS